MTLVALYKKLPAPIQNTALSIYSYFLFGSKYNKRTDCLILDSSSDQAQEAISKSFDKLVNFAFENVPFYVQFARENNISAGQITLENYKNFLPVITKSDIKKNPLLFKIENPSEKLTTFFTSGTSGSPLEIKCFISDRKKNYDFFRAILNKFGADIFSESATFAGRILFSQARNNVYWRRDSYLKTTYFSSYHLSEGTLQYYVEELNRRKPVFIDAYPSAILEVARYIKNKGISVRFSPKFVLTSSETLSDEARVIISSAFNNCLVVDHYGCTEMSVMAYSVDGQHYIFPAQYSLVEFLPLGDGLSKIICTGLINKAMPLIRYDMGDVCLNASVDSAYNQQCEKIVGREDDLIRTPEGNSVGRMDPVFKGVKGIDKAQIIQEKIDELLVNVVLHSGGENEFDGQVLINNIQSRVGNRMTITINLVDTIELTKSGKFKAVISRV